MLFKRKTLLFLKNSFLLHYHALTNSYSLIFFSDNKVFALLLILASFIDPVAGFCGLISALFSQVFASAAGFSRDKIRSGLFGFNSVLIGLGIGSYYEFSTYLIIMVFVAALLGLFFSIALDAFFGKYKLPFLSFPFILSLWILLLSSSQYFSLHYSERHIFKLNELYQLGGASLVSFHLWFENLPFPDFLVHFFKSLGSLLFQHDLLAGFIVAIGLIWYSRIAFSLALIGYFSGFLFYSVMGGEISLLVFPTIGFNFILTAIALGGYFFIPSAKSYIWVLISICLLAVVNSALLSVVSIFALPVYTLPFTIIVLLILFIHYQRVYFSNGPILTILQLNSPEKNLYEYLGNKKRFGKHLYSISLPVLGKYYISQGQDGKHTHQGDWRNAWDFEIRDEENHAFQGLGMALSDYFCFGKPVLAPGDGYIVEIADGIIDNLPGDVNTSQNWGNSIVIKHGEFLFSQLSHLKNGSIKVKVGDFVQRGDIIGSIGNSGRSPYPHLHFQVQSISSIGAKTIDFPLSNYFIEEAGVSVFKMHGQPKEGEKVESIRNNEFLYQAFHFIPGQKIKWRLEQKHGYSELEWEVFTNYYNQSYLYCHQSKSTAFFNVDNGVFYFLSFYGNKNSMLYHFSIALNKVILGFHSNVEINDVLPLNRMKKNVFMPLHDVIAPFYQFFKLQYSMRFAEKKWNPLDESMSILSATSFKVFGYSIRQADYTLTIGTKGIEVFEILIGKQTYKLLCLSN